MKNRKKTGNPFAAIYSSKTLTEKIAEMYRHGFQQKVVLK